MLCNRAGSILDTASEQLESIRASRAENLSAVRQLVTGIARELQQKGASEVREPTIMRGRFCVAVKVNHRSALPKGSIKLGASGTGTCSCGQPAFLSMSVVGSSSPLCC